MFYRQYLLQMTLDWSSREWFLGTSNINHSRQFLRSFQTINNTVLAFDRDITPSNDYNNQEPVEFGRSMLIVMNSRSCVNFEC